MLRLLTLSKLPVLWRPVVLSATALIFALIWMGCLRAASQAEPSAIQTDLLAGRSAIKASGVLNAGRVNDGVLSQDGDFWRTDVTSVFESPTAYLEYDLGQSAPIRNALIQADNDDRYTLSISDDGQRWRTLWVADQAHGRGMQTRSTEEVDGVGRFVRIMASGGDGNYSVGEVAIYTSRPSTWPPRLGVRQGMQPGDTARWRVQ